METKKKYHTDNLRLKLLKTASEIISEEGIKKLTMRSLSSRVGVSRTAPYRHFKNKESLLLAIAGQGFHELTRRYQEINQDLSLDSFSRLQNIGLAYIEFAIKNPGAFRLMFGPDMVQHQRSEELSPDARDTFNEFLKAVKALQDVKNMPGFEYSILANYFWTIVHGLAILLIDGQIQTTGKNYGLPTLLGEGKPNMTDDIQSLVKFSKDTIMNFWEVILTGISSQQNWKSLLSDKHSKLE